MTRWCKQKSIQFACSSIHCMFAAWFGIVLGLEFLLSLYRHVLGVVHRQIVKEQSTQNERISDTRNEATAGDEFGCHVRVYNANGDHCCEPNWKFYPQYANSYSRITRKVFLLIEKTSAAQTKSPPEMDEQIHTIRSNLLVYGKTSEEICEQRWNLQNGYKSIIITEQKCRKKDWTNSRMSNEAKTYRKRENIIRKYSKRNTALCQLQLRMYILYSRSSWVY